ncbi:MAG: hypothetical protein R3B09_18680 [Nannocystaceae bacterium]
MPLRSAPPRALLRRSIAALALVAASIVALAPTRARADAQLAGDPPKKVREPGPLEKGFVGEVAWRPALGIFSQGPVPEMRLHVALGGAIGTRMRLSMAPNVSIYLDRPKASGIGVDLLWTVYPVKRFYVRFGAGAISSVPHLREDRIGKPGYGGLIGLGYEWHMKKKANFGCGVDVDVRALKDGTTRTTVISGVHFAFY